MRPNAPRNCVELSHAVRALLEADENESNRFASMDLCAEIMDCADLVPPFDEHLRDTLRSWVARLQARFQR